MPLAVLAAALLFDVFEAVTQFGPPRLYYLTGIQCMACGGTRSVAALLRGDIVRSFLYNPAVIFSGLLGITFYTELVQKILGRDIKVVPRSKVFWIVTASLFAIFYIGRNVMTFIF